MVKNQRVTKLFQITITILLISAQALSFSSAVQAETTRTGAWLDSLTFDVVNAENALSSIIDGTIQMYTPGLTSDYKVALADPEIDVEQETGSYKELTLNPAVFTDTSQINPFSVPAIREALNKLIDRDHIAQAIFEGLAVQKISPILTDYPDYERYSAKIAELESEYAYNPGEAAAAISAEMTKLGATYSEGKWWYSGELVTLIFLIRTEDLRLQTGDYIADQLESVGFTVDRQYMTSSEASPLWLYGDPAEGSWHLYTGGWITTAVPRDEGDDFQFFYSPNSAYGFTPLWQAYDPTPEFLSLSELLANKTYTTMAERDTAFERALELALEDSVRVWLVDNKSYTPRSVDTTSAFDKASGFSSDLYPYTVRFIDVEGGDMTIGSPNIFVDAWNPIDGSSWSYDWTPIQATTDDGVFTNPTNGLAMPQRIESATVTAQTGLPVQKTMDWVDLEFSAVITIPTDAWSDWDAVNQQFITTGDVYPSGATALIKSVVTYPEDLFDTVTWHDDSSLSIGDFVFNMIIQADRAKEDSMIFDENANNFFDGYRVKAVRIVTTEPLVIETYSDYWQLDAENNVTTWWPEGGYGPSPWHTTALAAMIEEDELAAFSSNKADELEVEWTNYLNGQTLTYMSTELNGLTNEIPYANTLSTYITTDEVSARWANLKSWYAEQGHFWVGSGPFYVDEYDWDGKKLTLIRYENFPDKAGKWDAYSANPNPVLTINYSEGAPGSFFTITGSGYPPNTTARLYVNDIFNTEVTVDIYGSFEIILDTFGADVGNYEVVIKVNPAAIVYFELSEEADFRDKEGEGDVIDIIEIFELFLPIIL